MTREEIIKALEIFQGEINQSTFEEYTNEKKIELINEIINKKNQLEIIIHDLSNRLTDDNYYIDKELSVNKENLFSYLEDCIRLTESEENSNNNNIVNYKKIISYMEKFSPFQKSIIQTKIDSLEKRIIHASIDEERDKLLDEKNQNINELNLFDEIFQKQISNYKQKLIEFESKKLELTDAINNAKNQRESFEKWYRENSLVNFAKKKADEIYLSNYKLEISVFEAKEKSINYDYKKELDKIVSSYKNEEINTQDLQKKLAVFAKNLELEFFNESNVDIVDSSLKDLKKVRTIIEKEISELEFKLDNQENYKIPDYLIENRLYQLESFNNRGKSIEIEKELQNRENSLITNDIHQLQKFIDELKIRKDIIIHQKERAGLSIGEEYKNILNNEMANIERIIACIYSYKETCARNAIHADNIQYNLEEKQEFYVEMSNSLKKMLNEHNDINNLLILKDKHELKRLKNSLSLLKSRKNNLNQLALNDLVSKLLSVKDILINQEPDDNLSKLNNKDTSNDNKKSVNYDLPIISSELGLPVEVIDKAMKAFYSKNENEKLAKKVKRKSLVSKLKKWIKRTSLIASLVLLSTTGKGLEKDIMKDVQSNPTKYENKTDDELKELTKFFNESQVPSTISLTLNEDGQVDRKSLVKQTDEFLAGLDSEKYDYIINDKKIINSSNNDSLCDVTPLVKLKTDDKIALKTSRGNYGNGQERKDNLTSMGYDYRTVQDEVNQIMAKEQPHIQARKENQLTKSEVEVEKNLDSSTVPVEKLKTYSRAEIVPFENINNNSNFIFADNNNVEHMLDADVYVEDEKSLTTSSEELKGHQVYYDNKDKDTSKMNSVELEPTDNFNNLNVSIDVGDGESFVLNNATGKLMHNNDKNDFLTNPNTIITQSNNGTVLNISGNTASNVTYDHELTAEELKTKREALTHLFGGDTTTNEEIEQLDEGVIDEVRHLY